MKPYIGILFLVISFMAEAEDVSCETLQTTIEINICGSREAADAQNEMEMYLAKAVERYTSETKTIEALPSSQEAWLTYRGTYCDAVYELWSSGTIRGAMYNECLLHLTKQRTHTIWSDYLTYADSTDALLPEPQ